MGISVPQRAAHPLGEGGHIRQLQTTGEAGRKNNLWVVHPHLCRQNTLCVAMRTNHAPPVSLVQYPLWWKQGVVFFSGGTLGHPNHVAGLGAGVGDTFPYRNGGPVVVEKLGNESVAFSRK